MLQKRVLRRRKAPSQSRLTQTVELIIEPAARVLESEGFAGFNTGAIARRVGLSVGSLYQYFPSKDALAVALIRCKTKRLCEAAAAAIEQPNGRAALNHLITTLIREQLQRPMLARLLDVEATRPALREEMEDLTGALHGLLATIASRAKPGHERPEVAADDVLAIIRGMADGASQRGESDVGDLERRVRAAVFGNLSMARNALKRPSPIRAIGSPP